MNKYIVMIAVLVMLLTSCAAEETQESKPEIVVSILPQKSFVEAVVGDLADVTVLIPPGASPSNYQPSPKEMTSLSDAEVYFTIGVATETVNILPNIAESIETLSIVSLADAVDAVYPARYFEDEAHGEDDHDSENEDEEDHEEEHEEEEHAHEGRDPHIWMSPKRVVVMIETIRDTMIQLDPDNKAIYEANAASYTEELRTLDETLTENLSGHEGDKFIIMHPSLGYFADDYYLEMVAIEEDGKEASVSHLQYVIDYGVANDIHVVLYQQEFDSTQAETIAEELDGEALAFEPLAEDYLNNMKVLSSTFISIFQ